jgi:hypothetical protein
VRLVTITEMARAMFDGVCPNEAWVTPIEGDAYMILYGEGILGPILNPKMVDEIARICDSRKHTFEEIMVLIRADGPLQ